MPLQSVVFIFIGTSCMSMVFPSASFQKKIHIQQKISTGVLGNPCKADTTLKHLFRFLRAILKSSNYSQYGRNKVD